MWCCCSAKNEKSPFHYKYVTKNKTNKSETVPINIMRGFVWVDHPPRVDLQTRANTIPLVSRLNKVLSRLKHIVLICTYVLQCTYSIKQLSEAKWLCPKTRKGDKSPLFSQFAFHRWWERLFSIYCLIPTRFWFWCWCWWQLQLQLNFIYML